MQDYDHECEECGAAALKLLGIWGYAYHLRCQHCGWDQRRELPVKIALELPEPDDDYKEEE